MNLQQVQQPKSSAIGFGRRRTDREGGMRLENKLQSGKSNQNRSRASAKVGVNESPSHDRLVYLSTCLIGHPVEVQLKNGSVYSGTCYTTHIDKEFGIILKMAQMTKDVSLRGQKSESVSKAPSKTLIVPGKEVVQVIAKDMTMTIDGISNKFQHQKQQDFMIDSHISQSRHVESERELAPWTPDEDDPHCPELENTFDDPWNRGWDQFEANETLFGVKSTFDEELYTTKLERGPQMKELERKAMRIAREIEGEETEDLHLAEERGMQLHGSFDIDEETRFSSVIRGRRVDDSGYDEHEDIMSDLRNNETFGGESVSSTKKPADVTYGKSIDGARGLSNSSLDDAQCSQSSAGSDICLGSYDHMRQQASELPSESCTPDSQLRMPDCILDENDGNDGFKVHVEEQAMSQTQADNAQLPKSEDRQSLPNVKKDVSDKAGLSTTAMADAPAKSHEKMSSTSELSASNKGGAEMQSSNSLGERPGSSVSSNSSCVGIISSAGSTSEKSTLHSALKEFKFNPNAKSFAPSQTPLRPPSLMPDGSFYYPANVSTLPHMHGMPFGVGIGPSFVGHQPVIFNPLVAPMQTPQAYFQAGGPQYGQPMLLGHPPQVLYMPPSYRPERPPQRLRHKGRQR